jgi:hypothetical protein
MLGDALHPPNLALVVASCIFFESISKIAHVYIPVSLKANHAKLDNKSVRDLEISFSSTIHAIFACVMGLWIVLAPDAAIGFSGGDPKLLLGYSPRSNFTFAVSAGFFLWDLLVIITDPTQFDIPFLIHAIVCFLSYLFGLFPFLHFYGAAFLLFEISTPALNLRKAMLALGLKNHEQFKSIEKAFFVMFVTARLGFGLPMSYYIWKDLIVFFSHDDAHNRAIIAFYLFANFASCSLNIYWFILMVKKAFGKPKSASKKDKSHDNVNIEKEEKSS